MTYCNMYVQVEAAYETLSRLGEMSCVQFLDVSTEWARNRSFYFQLLSLGNF